MLDRSDIEKNHEAMRAERRREEPAWRDIARIIRPDDQEFDPNARVDRDDYDVYDSSPLYALDEFAGGMFSENVNPAERWMELETDDPELNKWGPVQSWLWGEASLLFNSLSPAVSNFYSEITPTFANLGAFGNGFHYQEEWLGRQTIVDQAVPMGQCYIRLDAGGNLEGFDREYKLTGRQMFAMWGKENCGGCREEQSYNIVHAVYRNPDFKAGMLGAAGMAFASTRISPDEKGFRIDKGYHEMPYSPFFWNKRAGRSYASGPGHATRADMNMNNEIARSLMVDAQFSAEPMVATHKEGIWTAADMQPSAILEGALNAEGKKLLDYVQRGDNPARAESKHDQVKSAIREGYLFSLWQVKNRPQMTATEFLGWKAERLRLLGPNLVRTQGGLAAVVARRYRILQRAQQTTPPPPEMKGRNVAVKFVSPFAKAQQLATGQAVMQWVGALGQLAEFAQDPSVMDLVNKDGAGRVLHKALVGMPDVINDQRAVAGIRQARAEQQAQQQQLEQAAQGAGIIADVAHASQALTSSKSRGTPGKTLQ